MRYINKKFYRDFAQTSKANEHFMKEILKNKLTDIITERGCITVSELANILKVSQSTVRRALDDLEKKKIVVRTHGGAKAIKQDGAAPNFVLRKHTNEIQKKLIVLKALKLIKEGNVVFLDGSTSTFFMAEYLNEFNDITVVTNGIDTLTVLSSCGVNAVSTGGNVSKANNSVLVGPFAISTIEKIHADIAFFSCGAISKTGLLSDYYLDEVPLRRKMIENADKVVLLCDSEKFDRTETYSIGDISEIDYVITDKNISGFEGVESLPEIIV